MPRKTLILGLLLAVVVAAGVAVLVGGCGGSSANSGQAQRRTEPLQTIFEAQQLLTGDPGPTLNLLKRLGVDDVKVFMAWGSMAPNPQSRTVSARFDALSSAAYPPGVWAPYDALVRAAAARGIGVDLALEGPAPLWATGSGAPPHTVGSFLGAWKPSAGDFRSFVTAVAKRYSGGYRPPGEASPLPRVSFWSIWNEPNYGQQLAPQAVDNSQVEVSPIYYRALLGAAWGALQATGHGADTVLIGEVAPRGITTGDNPGNFSGMVPLRFIRALYCVGPSLQPLRGAQATLRGCPTTAAASNSFARDNPALFHASGFAFHPYPQQYPPNVRTPDEPDYADLPQLPALERTLDGAVAAYSSNARLPLYDTEFGYQTNPPEKILRAIRPSLAAAWSNQAEYMSWRDPRVVSWDQYLLTDPPPPSMFDTGIQFADGKPKAPLYDAFRVPIYLPITTGTHGRALEVWGCVRPMHSVQLSSKAPQSAELQFKATGQAKFQKVKSVPITDPHGYFDTFANFASSGLLRIAWSYPHGETIHSRTVQITIR